MDSLFGVLLEVYKATISILDRCNNCNMRKQLCCTKKKMQGYLQLCPPYAKFWQTERYCSIGECFYFRKQNLILFHEED